MTMKRGRSMLSVLALLASLHCVECSSQPKSRRMGIQQTAKTPSIGEVKMYRFDKKSSNSTVPNDTKPETTHRIRNAAGNDSRNGKSQTDNESPPFAFPSFNRESSQRGIGGEGSAASAAPTAAPSTANNENYNRGGQFGLLRQHQQHNQSQPSRTQHSSAIDSSRIAEMNSSLFKLLLPMMATFAINPLVSALDLFWVNRLGDALAVAGQAAANQVYSSSFWIFSFLPAVTATIVSKRHASGDTEGTQEAICQALVISSMIAVSGSMFMFFNPEKALGSILKVGAPALTVARPYLRIRAFSFLPMMISFVGFSALRGIMDIKSGVKIAVCANTFTLLLDPLLIHVAGFGVKGAAMATLTAEVASASAYLFILLRRKLITWSKLWRLPSISSMAPVLKGGMALQIRSVAFNISFLMVARVIQSIDDTGISAAAHAIIMQTTQLGGITLGALSMVAQTIVPNVMVERYDEQQKKHVGGTAYAKAAVRNLMRWGLIFGVGVGVLQLILLPGIMKSSPLPEVRAAAKLPATVSSCLQVLNGLVMVGEGIMIGTGSFVHLAINIIIATLSFIASLQFLPERFGLLGVTMGLGIFTFCRLIGVLAHQMYHGPLAIRSPTPSPRSESGMTDARTTSSPRNGMFGLIKNNGSS